MTALQPPRRLTRPYLVASTLTGVLLVKGTTLGLAVLAMIVFMLRNGQSVPLPQIVLFALLSLTGLGLTTRFIRAISRSSSRTQPSARTETQPD